MEWTETVRAIGDDGMMPKTQWTSGKFSIIAPCGVTFDQYELYPVDGDIERFATLEEAKARAEELTTSSS